MTKRMLRAWILAVIWMGFAASGVWGQEQTQTEKTVFVPHFFNLQFVVKEIEGGKVINSRQYMTTVVTAPPTAPNYQPRSLRTGERVQISGNDWYQTGINIDVKNPRMYGDRLAIDISGSVTGLQDWPATGGASSRPTVISEKRWDTAALVVPGKATLVYSSDEVISKGTLKVEMTATEIK